MNPLLMPPFVYSWQHWHALARDAPCWVKLQALLVSFGLMAIGFWTVRAVESRRKRSSNRERTRGGAGQNNKRRLVSALMHNNVHLVGVLLMLEGVSNIVFGIAILLTVFGT
jgi:hypothetical protein